MGVKLDFDGPGSELILRHLRVAQVAAGEYRVAERILELQKGCPADRLDGLLVVGHTRQLDRDSIGALNLDDRLGNAERVDAAFDDGQCPLHHVPGDGRVVRRPGLHDDMHAALQIEAQLHRHEPQACGRGDQGREYSDEFPNTTAFQFRSPLNP